MDEKFMRFALKEAEKAAKAAEPAPQKDAPKTPASKTTTTKKTTKKSNTSK